jgi:predicted DCC family thiol-disulfide oxidoreductase YuxK
MKTTVIRNWLSSLIPTSATDLGMVRAGVHGVFFFAVLFTSFEELGHLPVTILRPVGIMSLLSWKFYARLVTPGGMKALQIVLLISLFMSMIGYLTSITTKSSAVLVILYQGLLRSFGHFNHDEMTGIYFLLILAFTPCGDAFSLDSVYRPRNDRKSSAYGYPILLMQLVLAWCYFTAGLSKLRISGLAYFGNDNLAIQAINHSLDNLHETQFRFAFWLLPFRDYLGIIMAITIAWEILFPLAIFSRRLRWWFLGFGVLFHVVTLFTMNIFFSNLMMMYLIFIDWKAVFGWFARRRLFRKLAAWYRGFRYVPEFFPGTEVSEYIPRETLLWDGKCGFCARMVNLFRSWSRRPFNDRPFQGLEALLPLEVRQSSHQQMLWVSRQGAVVGGSQALIEVIGASGYRLLAALLENPLCRPFTWFGYRVVAHNRSKLSGVPGATQTVKAN